VTDNRQTDHARDKCVAIDGIAYARAILPKTILISIFSCHSGFAILVCFFMYFWLSVTVSSYQFTTSNVKMSKVNNLKCTGANLRHYV